MIDSWSFQSSEDAFGTVRAEWLSDDVLFSLFTEPTYYPELRTPRPCVLQGGRGTGKTTVLRCLSYQGMYGLSERDDRRIAEWPFYGMYYRVNTNRVTAFRGPELTDVQWTKVFAHYVNLLLCGQIVDFVYWLEQRDGGMVNLSTRDWNAIASSLHIEPCETCEDLRYGIRDARTKFEAFLNNLNPESIPLLSLQGQPIDELCERLLEAPTFKNKSFFFIIDEFENLLDYQQVVFNTLIKHATAYSFKVGVKELGWRKRSTLNENEQLTSPADYEMIDISTKLQTSGFQVFAEKICNDRLSNMAAVNDEVLVPLEMSDLFENLSMDREAELLGVKPKADLIRQSKNLTKSQKSSLAQLSDLETFFVGFWASNQNLPLGEVVDEAALRSRVWRDRYDNYKHAMLFLVRKGKSGIRKYYSGWDTLVRLSGGNIRYILQLVNESVLLHAREEKTVATPISAATQTKAAERVGRTNLSELEGLDVNGARITKLLLSLGRVFQVMAFQLEGTRPEVNQFTLSPGATLSDDVGGLLTASIMHQALVRSTANKLSGDTDLRSYDYAIHPIYAPFFVFSHRKKRKFTIEPDKLLGLVHEPAKAITGLLSEKHYDDAGELPKQLRLFEEFYATDKR